MTLAGHAVKWPASSPVRLPGRHVMGVVGGEAPFGIIYTGIVRVGSTTAPLTIQYEGNGDLNAQPFFDTLTIAAEHLAAAA